MMFEIKGKTILVTGATGYIGSHISKRLLEEGAKVRALARNPAKASMLRATGIEVIYGDITDQVFVREAVKGCRVIFHFAAVLGNEYRPLDYFQKVNREGTNFLVEAALLEKVERFIHASTAWVYGFDAKEKTNENSPLQFSKDPYCDTKVEAELLVRENIKKNNLPGIIIQPTQVYGPGDETWTLGPINLIKSYAMIYPRCGRGLVQPIFIDDLVDGIIAASKKGRVGEAYLLCGEEVVKIKEFFGYFSQIEGRKWVPPVPSWLALILAILLEKAAHLRGRQPLFTMGAVRGTLMSATYCGEKAKSELNFFPKVTLKEGMKQVEKWVRTLG